MGKLEEYMKGRTEGMEFALRLVKDKGIEELEKRNSFPESYRNIPECNQAGVECGQCENKGNDIGYIYYPWSGCSP